MPSTRHELVRGLSVGFGCNLAVAALLIAFEPSTKAWLAVMGAANEVLGVLMIASPELLPRMRRLFELIRDWLRKMLRRGVATLRRLFHLPSPVHVVGVGGIGAASQIAGGRVVTGPPADKDELIKWLVEQVQHLSNALYTLQTQVQQLPAEWRKDISAAQSEAERHAERLVQGLAHQNIELRLLGVGFVVLGIVLGAAAHLV